MLTHLDVGQAEALAGTRRARPGRGDRRRAGQQDEQQREGGHPIGGSGHPVCVYPFWPAALRDKKRHILRKRGFFFPLVPVFISLSAVCGEGPEGERGRGLGRVRQGVIV